MRMYLIQPTQIRLLAQQVAYSVGNDSKEKQQAYRDNHHATLQKRAILLCWLKFRGKKVLFPPANRSFYLHLSDQMMSYQGNISHNISMLFFFFFGRPVQPIYIITVLLLTEVNSKIPISTRNKNTDGSGKTHSSPHSNIMLNHTSMRKVLYLIGLQICN